MTLASTPVEWRAATAPNAVLLTMAGPRGLAAGATPVLTGVRPSRQLNLSEIAAAQ